MQARAYHFQGPFIDTSKPIYLLIYLSTGWMIMSIGLFNLQCVHWKHESRIQWCNLIDMKLISITMASTICRLKPKLIRRCGASIINPFTFSAIDFLFSDNSTSISSSASIVKRPVNGMNLNMKPHIVIGPYHSGFTTTVIYSWVYPKLDGQRLLVFPAWRFFLLLCLMDFGDSCMPVNTFCSSSSSLIIHI